MSPRSVNTIARTLIQTVVRQKLNAIKSDPERSLRNLVDMGLSFAAGSEQKRFLQQAQRTLQNENSAYYRIIYDMALHVDTEHLMGFGMNLGYNSLTAGARTIRRLEVERGYDIPWCLTLVIDRKGYAAHEADYISLIEQGKRLGIYTYLIIAPELPVGLFTLLRQQKDCAFLLFTSPDELTGDVIDTMAQLYHVMPVVRFGDGAEEVCDAMRRREMLYSVFLPYHSEKSENIFSDGDVLDIEQFHAPLTIFISYTARKRANHHPFTGESSPPAMTCIRRPSPWSCGRTCAMSMASSLLCPPTPLLSMLTASSSARMAPWMTASPLPPPRWKASLPPCNKISPGSAGIPQDRDSFYHFRLGVTAQPLLPALPRHKC